MDNFDIAEKVYDHMGLEELANFGREGTCYLQPDEVEDEALKELLYAAEEAISKVYEYLGDYK